MVIVASIIRGDVPEVGGGVLGGVLELGPECGLRGVLGGVVFHTG